MQNSQCVVISYTKNGMEITHDMFEIKNCDFPTIKANEMIIQLQSLSVDPYLRGPLAKTSGWKLFELGKPGMSGAVGTVIESQNPAFAAGDLVTGVLPWQKYVVSDGAGLRKLPTDLPPSVWVGSLGLTGLTAYFGLLRAGELKRGDVVVVSTAAGAVGSVVGQLARIYGAKKVIGTAGGPEKCAHAVKKYKYDACLDYKKYNTKEAMKKALGEVAPEGIDLYFDCTGGHVTDAVLDSFNKFGRLAVCGQMSCYNANNPQDPKLSDTLMRMIGKSLTFRAVHAPDYAAEYEEFYSKGAKLIKSGELVYDETVYEGLQQLPDALIGLFRGNNLGKAIVSIPK